MYTQPDIHEPSHFSNIPMIDEEFDRFELTADLETHLREAETANFYNDTLDPQE